MSLVPSDENYVSPKDLTFQELMALEGPGVIESTGYDLVEKDSLIHVPFVVTTVTFRQSDKNNVGYVSMEAITQDEERVIINDGSTGIFMQLVRLAIKFGVLIDAADTILADDKPVVEYLDESFDPDTVRVWYSTSGEWNLEWQLGILRAKHGLRKSDYEAREINGRKVPAGTTFYIA